MKLRIVLAFGGSSFEHEISILTAMQVYEVMKHMDYELIPLYIDKQQNMYTHLDLFHLKIHQRGNYDKYEKVYISSLHERAYIGIYGKKKKIEFDFVLPLFHGRYGEDGCFQGYLKTMGIPFGLHDVSTSSILMDKVFTKRLLQDDGIRVVPWFSLHQKQGMNDLLFEKTKRLKYPLILKPANLGSSIGIQVVNNIYECKEGLKKCFQFDDMVLIEKYIEKPREFHISVLGSMGDYEVSGIEEVFKDDQIYSFADKYMKNKGKYHHQDIVDIKDDEIEQMKQYALVCADLIRCDGIMRLDFIMDQETRDIYVNEINNIPGSLAHYLWKNKSFPQIIERIIELGIQRYKKEYAKHLIQNINLLSLSGKK